MDIYKCPKMKNQKTFHFSKTVFFYYVRREPFVISFKKTVKISYMM